MKILKNFEVKKCVKISEKIRWKNALKNRSEKSRFYFAFLFSRFKIAFLFSIFDSRFFTIKKTRFIKTWFIRINK